MPSISAEELEQRKAALERYNEAFNKAHGYYPGVKLLKPAKPAAPVEKQTRSKPPKETGEQWRDRMVKQYNLVPLQAVTPPPYNVADPGRYQKAPPFLARDKKPLLRNVSRAKYAHDLEEHGIEPEDFKKWRVEYLGMSPEQLGAVIRVTARTIRAWELGQNRIPFMMYWVMQQLKPSDLPAGYDLAKPTRYYKPVIQDGGSVALRNVLKRYAYVMKEHGITAGEFYTWRKSFMMMSAEQVGQLLRVPPKTIEAWESGKAPIPFSVWWVMHTMMQDPEVFVNRPGFHDFHIEYRNGEAMLCSAKYPEVRFTPSDLHLARSAMQSVERLNRDLNAKDKQIEELQAENTRLRQMLKAGTVTAELKAMHDHIGELMRRMHTADVVEFPEQETAEVIKLPQAAA